ncbi:hypothetical protein M758_UG221300 [Ceratodon purpureus]|nr:hypothetical protein M758_UG221300 [Ceratodon purpureus]
MQMGQHLAKCHDLQPLNMAAIAIITPGTNKTPVIPSGGADSESCVHAIKLQKAPRMSVLVNKRDKRTPAISLVGPGFSK